MAEKFGEDFAEPRSAGEDKVSRGKRAAAGCRQLGNWTAAIRRDSLSDQETGMHPFGFFDHGLHGATREQDTAAGFQQAAADAIEIYLRISLRELCAVHDFVSDAATLDGGLRFTQPEVVRAFEPEYAGLLKERLAACRRKFFPLDERTLRPARVDLVGRVAHADDARFAAGAGARVGRAVGIEHQDFQFAFRKVPGRPRAENARADHNHIVSRGFRHCPGILQCLLIFVADYFEASNAAQWLK
jgi:hypothetical protein